MAEFTAKSSMHEVSTVAVQIAASDRNRVYLRIKSEGDLKLGGAGVVPAQAYTVINGRELEFNGTAATAEIFAVTSLGNDNEVEVFEITEK